MTNVKRVIKRETKKESREQKDVPKKNSHIIVTQRGAFIFEEGDIWAAEPKFRQTASPFSVDRIDKKNKTMTFRDIKHNTLREWDFGEISDFFDDKNTVKYELFMRDGKEVQT